MDKSDNTSTTISNTNSTTATNQRTCANCGMAKEERMGNNARPSSGR